MRNYKLLLCVLLAGCGMLRTQAQTVVLSVPDTTVALNASVRIPVRTTGFTAIANVQFSLQWDTAIIVYQGNQAGALDDAAVGDFQAERGELRFSWLDFEDTPRTLADGSVLVYLDFMAKGAEGSTTSLNFTNTPINTEIYRKGSNPGEFDKAPLELDQGSVTIVELMTISVSETVTDISCFGADDGAISVAVLANENFTINWSGPNFSSSETTIDSLAPGSYNLQITNDGGGMLYESSFLLTEPNQLVISSINATDAGCTTGKGSAQVVFTGGAAPYTYDLGNGPGPVSILENLEPGTYALILADANGCMAGDTFSIDNPGLPELELGESRQICPGESTTLKADDFSTYAWSNGATTAAIEVSQTGTYSLTVTDSNGCQANDAVEVQSGAQVQLLLDNDFLDLCPGDSIELMISGADTYSWIDTSGSLSALDIANPMARPDTIVGYTVIGSSTCGADTMTLEVFVYEVMAMAGPDTCIGPGTEAQLIAYGGMSYLWEEARYPVSNAAIPNPTASPEDSTTYVVAITDFQGCTIRDSVVVLVATDPEASITAVNMITPNGDERNDVLYFSNIEKYGQNSLKVFNRWGNTVYQKVNYQSDEERFDGTYKGQDLPPGTYYYLLTFRTGEIKQKLTILR